jgi:hypothetical protein
MPMSYSRRRWAKAVFTVTGLMNNSAFGMTTRRPSQALIVAPRVWICPISTPTRIAAAMTSRPTASSNFRLLAAAQRPRQ